MDKQTYRTRAGITQFRPIATTNEVDDHMGFCLACGAEAQAVEPDARGYACEGCGEPKVYGLEELALMGLLTIVEEQ